jgi:hypothetical protein
LFPLTTASTLLRGGVSILALFLTGSRSDSDDELESVEDSLGDEELDDSLEDGGAFRLRGAAVGCTVAISSASLSLEDEEDEEELELEGAALRLR